MQFKILLVLASFVQYSVASYSCYTAPDATTAPTNVGYTYSGIGGQCSSYQYTCSSIYNATCTAMEINSKSVKFAFTYFTQASCDQMYADPSFSNVCCCNTDSCNAPSLKFGCNTAGVPNNFSVITSNPTTTSSLGSTGLPVAKSAGLALGSFGSYLSSSVVAAVFLLML